MSQKPIRDYPVHPAAALMPFMPEDEFEDLKEDIRVHGQHDDVVIWDGQLIDGRHRLRACIELGIEPNWTELPKTSDPAPWVFSHNVHRRHMTTSQRAMVATEYATLLHGDVKSQKDDASIGASSQAEAAKQLHVSRRSVQRARTVQAKASPIVIAAVKSGKMSLNAAVASTIQSNAEKKAKEKAKAAAAAAKAKAKEEARIARETAKAEKAAEKAAKEAAKAKAKAEKEAAIAAARTPQGQITNLKSLINQHLGKLVRHLDDLHRLKPNRARRDENLKCLQGIKLW